VGRRLEEAELDRDSCSGTQAIRAPPGAVTVRVPSDRRGVRGRDSRVTTDVAVASTAQKSQDRPFGRLHRYTYWLLWVVVFTVPWQNLILIDGVGTITRLVGLAAAGAAGLAVAAEGRRHPITDTHILMVLFTGWVIASSVWTIRPDVTWDTAFRVIQLLALAWMVGEFADGPARLRGIMWAYVLGVALTAGIMIFEFQFNPTTAARYSASENAHPNGIAFMMCLGIPMAWYLSMLVRRNWVRVGLWLTIPLTVLAVLMTASRSAMLLLAVAGLIIPLTWGRLSRSLRRACIVGAVLLVPFIASYVPDKPLERLSAITEGIESDALDMRKTLLETSWDIVGQRPLLGVGAGASRYEIADLSGLQQGSHNTYLSVATELGVVGLVLYLLIMSTIALRLLSTTGLRRKLAFVLGATLALGLVPRHWEYDKTTWLMFAILLAVGMARNFASEPGDEPLRVVPVREQPPPLAPRPRPELRRPQLVLDRDSEWT
jgi:O-antigen ligase